MKKIIAFAASNSKSSINKQLVTYTANMLVGTDVTVLDLNNYDVPLFSVDLEHSMAGQPINAHKFLDKIREADGIVISMAEHNGAYTAVFKNLFDWVSRIEKNTFFNKPMLLMATSTGVRGGQSVLGIAKDRFPRHAANIVATFSLPSFSDNFKDGKIVDSTLNDTLKETVKEFINALSIMDIQQENDNSKGSFYIEREGVRLAQMTYTFEAPNSMVIDHTEVDARMKGQGVGYKLVDAAVEYARAHALKIVPTCTFVASVFKRKAEIYADVTA